MALWEGKGPPEGEGDHLRGGGARGERIPVRIPCSPPRIQVMYR